MLAEKLAEVAYLKETHALGHRVVCLLKEEKVAAARDAEAACARLTAAAAEERAGLERRLAQASPLFIREKTVLLKTLRHECLEFM